MTNGLVTGHFASQMTYNALVTIKLKANLIKMSIEKSLKMLLDDYLYVILGIQSGQGL